jgi:glutamine synthetase
MDIGADVLPRFPKDATDRNRTSPFAFTGNKFEFRMVGSSLSISGPCFILNTIVADVLGDFADRLEKAANFEAELADLIKETVVAHERIIFNGNNYAQEWTTEAEKRGLLNLRTTTDALPLFTKPENIALFEKHGVLSKTEVESRTELLLEAYKKILHIEALSMLELAHKDFVPAVIGYSADVARSLEGKKSLANGFNFSLEERLLAKLSDLGGTLNDDIDALESALANADGDASSLALAKYYNEKVAPSMDKLRGTVDALELLVDREHWPVPGYGEILYSVK